MTRAPGARPRCASQCLRTAGTVGVYGLQILDATLKAGNTTEVEADTTASALLKHEFLDGGADDVTQLEVADSTRRSPHAVYTVSGLLRPDGTVQTTSQVTLDQFPSFINGNEVQLFVQTHGLVHLRNVESHSSLRTDHAMRCKTGQQTCARSPSAPPGRHAAASNSTDAHG